MSIISCYCWLCASSTPSVEMPCLQSFNTHLLHKMIAQTTIYSHVSWTSRADASTAWSPSAIPWITHVSAITFPSVTISSLPNISFLSAIPVTIISSIPPLADVTDVSDFWQFLFDGSWYLKYTTLENKSRNPSTPKQINWFQTIQLHISVIILMNCNINKADWVITNIFSSNFGDFELQNRCKVFSSCVTV